MNKKNITFLAMSACAMLVSSSIWADTLVLKNANVYTMDANKPTAKNVVSVDGVITYVGNEEPTLPANEKVHSIDLNGKTVFPGFIDGHIHAAAEEMSKTTKVFLTDKKPDVQVYLDTIKDYSQKHPNLKVIQGERVQLKAFENGIPTKELLDSVVPDRPVIIADTTNHIFWVNSKALELAGVTGKTKVPEGGKMPLNEKGEPVGILIDNARDFIAPLIKLEPVSAEQYKNAFKAFQEKANSLGVTSVNAIEITGNTLSIKEVWKILSEMDKDHELTLRVNMYNTLKPGFDIDKHIQQMQESQKELSSDFLYINTFKMFADGVAEGGTAYLVEPYPREAQLGDHYHGAPIWKKAQFNETIKKVNDAGLNVHIHAIGDGAVKESINAIEGALKDKPTKDPRHSITHVSLIEPIDITRMAKNNITASIQPIWFYDDPIFAPQERKMLGDERFKNSYPAGDMVKAGVRITGSADAPVTPDFNPLVGIETGVLRENPYGPEHHPETLRNQEQRVPVLDMIKAYTINSAYQSGMDNNVGSIQKGKKADFVVLDTDIMTAPASTISEGKVLYTIVDGKVVFQNKDK